MSRTKIVFKPGGKLLTIYTESINLSALGALTIARASDVEPKGHIPIWKLRLRWRLRNIPFGQWYADMAKSRGPILGPFPDRSTALIAEVKWLEANRLKGEGNAKEGKSGGD